VPLLLCQASCTSIPCVHVVVLLLACEVVAMPRRGKRLSRTATHASLCVLYQPQLARLLEGCRRSRCLALWCLVLLLLPALCPPRRHIDLWLVPAIHM
jgi:hypothetical protein